jgi:hypothetical protein
MTKATAPLTAKGRIGARRMPINQAVKPPGQWLVLIGDGGDESDPDDVLLFLQEMFPDIERDTPH